MLSVEREEGWEGEAHTQIARVARVETGWRDAARVATGWREGAAAKTHRRTAAQPPRGTRGPAARIATILSACGWGPRTGSPRLSPAPHLRRPDVSVAHAGASSVRSLMHTQACRGGKGRRHASRRTSLLNRCTVVGEDIAACTVAVAGGLLSLVGVEAPLSTSDPAVLPSMRSCSSPSAGADDVDEASNLRPSCSASASACAISGPLCSMPIASLHARSAAGTVRRVPSMPSCLHAALMRSATVMPAMFNPAAATTIASITLVPHWLAMARKTPPAQSTKPTVGTASEARIWDAHSQHSTSSPAARRKRKLMLRDGALIPLEL